MLYTDETYIHLHYINLSLCHVITTIIKQSKLLMDILYDHNVNQRDPNLPLKHLRAGNVITAINIRMKDPYYTCKHISDTIGLIICCYGNTNAINMFYLLTHDYLLLSSRVVGYIYPESFIDHTRWC